MDLKLLDQIIRKLQDKKNMIIIQDIKQPDDNVKYVNNKNIVSADGKLNINFYLLNDMKGKIGFAIIDNTSEDEYYLYNERINNERSAFKREIEISTNNGTELYTIRYAISEENPDNILLLDVKSKDLIEEIDYDIKLNKSLNLDKFISPLKTIIEIDSIISDYYEYVVDDEEYDNEIDEEELEDENIIYYDNEIDEEEFEDENNIIDEGYENSDDIDYEMEMFRRMGKEFRYSDGQIFDYIGRANELIECLEKISKCLVDAKRDNNKVEQIIDKINDAILDENILLEKTEKIDKDVTKLIDIIGECENEMEDITKDIEFEIYSNYSVKTYENGKKIERESLEDFYTVQDYYSIVKIENKEKEKVFKRVSKLRKNISQIIQCISQKERNER